MLNSSRLQISAISREKVPIILVPENIPVIIYTAKKNNKTIRIKNQYM